MGVAVSGGADSVALLRLLLEIRASLGVVLSVVHFNHKLRGQESDDDEKFVRELASTHGLEILCDSADTRAYAAEHKCGIEAAARELRYSFFWKLLSPQRSQRSTEPLTKIATAHTMDDQAETVVLRFVRGAGTRGLSGIHPVLGAGSKKTFSAEDAEEQRAAIIRPLLDFRRAQLRHYLKRKGQAWREDASNQDAAYARNKVRHELMPKLREFNPAIEQVLSETAEIARAEEEYWNEQVERIAGHGARSAGKELLTLPLALQRRVIRAVAERSGLRLEFHHVQQILDAIRQAPTRSQKRIELTGDHDAVIVERELRFEPRCPNQQVSQYDLPLSVPGEVEVPAAGLVIATRLLQRGEAGSPSRAGFAGDGVFEGELLDPDRTGSLRIRNWRPGDRYWPAHTREPKKVKELLQARHVPAAARAHWPVVVGEVDGMEHIVWVPGFAFPEQLLVTNGSGVGLKLEHRLRG